ncbi:MAG TPA: hypothetical protein VKY92_24465 [Verrucomicrobiae bacterium]|nr:hypothetical protein [Verrucomicrobiae bacterium]
MNGILRKLTIFAVAMGLVAAGGWFGRKAYKRAVETRMVTQARCFAATNDFHNAELCIRRALQVNPESVPAIRMVADILEASGQPASVGWRVRVAQLQDHNVTNRFEWAQTALKFHELKSAEQALEGVPPGERRSAIFHKLRGALAWSTHDLHEAESQFSAALELEPTNQSALLNLDTVRLASTNTETALQARESLSRLTNSPSLCVTALRILEQDALARKAWPEALHLFSQLTQGPSATFDDKLAYLQLLKNCTNAQFSSWFSSIEGEATNSPVHAFAFARWMAGAQGPAAALNWTRQLPPTLRTNQPIPLITTDCQIALKDWPGLLSSISKQNWNEAEFYRCAMESLAYRSQNKEFLSKAAWQNAMRESARRLDRLTRLAQVTTGWGWQAENTEVLEKIASEFPAEKWAATSLMSRLYSSGNTRDLQEFLRKRNATDPSDVLVKNNLANLCLLRRSELDKAHRLAKEAHQAAPNDPFFSSTYAYSLLLQKRYDEALKVMGAIKREYLQIPSVAAYYGVIEAATGNKELARAALQCASTAKLLPEETELVKQAKAQL